ncbi:MAG: hypothetical protein HYT83_01975 [Candidatus Levybacteria bacterium]|nr:hypothetical protein [Candidatus Levybacteria bacterium]
MMGGELSINGTLAFARRLDGSGQLQTSGLSSLIDYENRNGTTSIRINMPYKTDRSIFANEDGKNNIVLFEGIGYLCTNKQSAPTMGELVTLAEKYKLPAFGIVIYSNNQIFPFVYVGKTQSMVAESACGSGSIALNILTGQQRIVQPTGKTIEVNHVKDRFTITAKVDMIR